MTRRVKRRRAARVIVLAGEQVLLQQDTDPGVPGSRWWVTPGGGADPGESAAQTAVREVREETGLELTPQALGEAVMSRRVIHGYSDRILIQDEVFFKVEVERFEPSPTALTAAEQTRLVGIDWYPVAHLPAPLWPDMLAHAIAAEGPLGHLGTVQESTVPVTEAELAGMDAPGRGSQEPGGR